MKNEQIYECPSYDRVANFLNAPAGTGCENRVRGGIGYNWSWTPVEGPGGDIGWLAYKKETRIERPAEFIILGDSDCMGFGPYNTNTFIAWQAGGWPGSNGSVTRHNDGMNVGYADGHAKFQKAQSIKENQLCRVSGLPLP